MKRFLFLTTFIIGASASTEAQITITQSDMAGANTSFLYETTADMNLFDFSLTGTNFAWDFSTATFSNYDTILNVSVSSTPFAYQLYFNNVILYPSHKASYAKVGIDVVSPFPAAQISITDRFDYYKVNGGSLEITGFGANINGIPTSVKYDVIDQIYPFPLTYGTTDSTDGAYFISVPSVADYGQDIIRVVEGDGYGSLVTPKATYPNVLRVKTTLYLQDTIFISQFGQGLQFARPTEVIYEWWDNNNKAPILVVNENGGQVTRVKYLADSGLGITENSDSDVSLVATATPFEFQVIDLNNEGVKSILVFDLNGKMVASKYDGNLKIKNGASQIYLAVIELNNGTKRMQKLHCIK